ncbi:MAG TPA: hypothetical protein PLV68_08930, partial [Ilumatobacteraceae bacterium]|nr:hypothetical protein [Ilumatobacteraceae bacterium]
MPAIGVLGLGLTAVSCSDDPGVTLTSSDEIAITTSRPAPPTTTTTAVPTTESTVNDEAGASTTTTTTTPAPGDDPFDWTAIGPDTDEGWLDVPIDPSDPSSGS